MNTRPQMTHGIGDADLEMIQSVAQAFAQKELPTGIARDAEAGDWSLAESAWRRIADLGWIGLMAPDAFGIQGLPGVAIIAEELGKAAFPLPYAETAAFVLPMLAGHNDGSLDQLIDAVVTGRQLVVLAMPVSGVPSAVEACAQLPLGANARGGAWVAEHLDRAAAVLMPVRTGQGAALALVRKPDGGWQAGANPDLSNNAYSTLNWDILSRAETTVLGDGVLDWATLETAYDVLRTAICAQIVGLAGAALELAVDYAKQREAFGKPIGSLQAVQQRLAEAFMENSAARLLVADAAIEPAQGAVAMASIQACEAGRKCTFTAQQIWAGMGYTLEVDVQLYFRRARARQLLLGSPWRQRETVWEDVMREARAR